MSISYSQIKEASYRKTEITSSRYKIMFYHTVGHKKGITPHKK